MNLRDLNLANIATVALALSDGTPVEFVKFTSKDNIQVRVPTSHGELGDDALRIFRRDGTHYKDQTDLTLTASAAGVSAAPTTAAAPAPTSTASNDNATYTVGDMDFDNLEDAKREAIDLFTTDPSAPVEIVVTTRKVVGTVGFSLAA